MSTDSPADANTEVLPLEQLKLDAAAARQRLLDTDVSALNSVQELAEWMKTELAFNLYPMFEATSDAIVQDVGAELDELRRDVAELRDGGEELSQETAAQIVGVFEMGRQLANMLERVLKTAPAEVATKNRAKQLIHGFRAAELAMREIVLSLVVDDGPDGDPVDGEPVNDEAEPDVAAADAQEG